jgi:hypothetical protein
MSRICRTSLDYPYIENKTIRTNLQQPHIDEIADKSSQQQFKGNKTMSAVITL